MMAKHVDMVLQIWVFIFRSESMKMPIGFTRCQRETRRQSQREHERKMDDPTHTTAPQFGVELQSIRLHPFGYVVDERVAFIQKSCDLARSTAAVDLRVVGVNVDASRYCPRVVAGQPCRAERGSDRGSTLVEHG